MQENVEVANASVDNKAVVDDLSYGDEEEFVVLTESSDSDNAVRNANAPEVDDDAQQQNNLDLIQNIADDVAAHVGEGRMDENCPFEQMETDAASLEGSMGGDQQANGLHAMRAGLHDVLLNDEVMNEENANLVEVVGHREVFDHENGYHLNVIENMDAVPCDVDDGDEEENPADRFRQLWQLGGSRVITFTVLGLSFLVLLSILYWCMIPNNTTKQKSSSQPWNHITQCPLTQNTSYIDHDVGTDSHWKLENDALRTRLDALERKHNATERDLEHLKEELAAAWTASDDFRKKFEWERGRAQMFFDLYMSMKMKSNANNCNPDWTNCWQTVARAIKSQVNGVPETVRHFEETMQGGLMTLKSLGLNVTEGIQSAFASFLKGFTGHSAKDKKWEKAENWKSSNWDEQRGRTPDYYKDKSFDQSGGKIPRNPTSKRNKNNRKGQYMPSGRHPGVVTQKGKKLFMFHQQMQKLNIMSKYLPRNLHSCKHAKKAHPRYFKRRDQCWKCAFCRH